MDIPVPDFDWFLDRVAGDAAVREARELMEAEQAARSVGWVVRWDPTWTCELLPAHDPEGRLDARESIDLDAHPAVDPRARDIERILLAAADLGSPEMAGGFCIEWRLEPTCRVYGVGGGLLIETNEARAGDAGAERYEAAHIIREGLDNGTLALPGLGKTDRMRAYPEVSPGDSSA